MNPDINNPTVRKKIVEMAEFRMKCFADFRAQGVDPVEFCTKICKWANPNDDCDGCIQHMYLFISERGKK